MGLFLSGPGAAFLFRFAVGCLPGGPDGLRGGCFGVFPVLHGLPGGAHGGRLFGRGDQFAAHLFDHSGTVVDVSGVELHEVGPGVVQTPIQWISKLLADYKTSQPVLKRVTDILNLPKDADHGEKLKTALPISVENLRFSYEEGEEVLHNLSVTFEPGKKYAIVGNSGSGKSTFMYVLMHYYNHFEGEIRFGSQSISDIQKKELYRSIALIHQNVVVLDGTLRDNVSLYESYSDENIKQALIRAGMGDYLNEKGLDFTIQESGSNLSGGEKQRIAIARAFLRNTPVMILDEATSSLDSLMAAKIEQTVLQSDTTILNIVHQLKADSLKQYDEILVFSKGAIIERGNYDELIQKDGIFRSLLSVMSA